MRNGGCAAIGLVLAVATGCGSGGERAASSGAGSVGASGSGGGSSSSGTGGASARDAGTGGATCPTCGMPAQVGALGSGALDEVSGVVASAAHRGVFYVHNDSGDTPRFFALDAAGALLATFTVSGATAIDWEDIARGPCPSGSCLYLADIGDNNEARASVTIYRVPEPASVADATVSAESFPFTYGDGAHNAETLLVDPASGVITVVTKVFVGASSIYELPMPLTPGTLATATKVGTVKPPDASVLFTGGDVHPAGSGVLLRTYTSVWYYPKAAGASVASALMGTPCELPVADESQGEAIGWLPAGAGYVTISEGVSAKVNRVDCGP